MKLMKAVVKTSFILGLLGNSSNIFAGLVDRHCLVEIDEMTGKHLAVGSNIILQPTKPIEDSSNTSAPGAASPSATTSPATPASPAPVPSNVQPTPSPAQPPSYMPKGTTVVTPTQSSAPTAPVGAPSNPATEITPPQEEKDKPAAYPPTTHPTGEELQRTLPTPTGGAGTGGAGEAAPVIVVPAKPSKPPDDYIRGY